MKKAQIAKTKYGSVDAGLASYSVDMAQKQTKLNQDLSKEYYYSRFCELARRLAAANTGQVLIAHDNYALWLEGYGEDFNFDYDDESDATDFSPVYVTYNYNSESYTTCNAEVNKAIMVHRANQLCHDLQEQRATRLAQAAELGYPSNLHFLHRDVDLGPSCQTWIIQSDGLPRVRDFSVGDTKSREYHEGWAQLLPGEVIATWEKNCLSGPHYFKLELYLDTTSVPKELKDSMQPLENPALAHITIDSCMDPLSGKQQRALESLFPTVQLECLGDLQAHIDCAYRDAIDPIYGDPSPDIAGGWLGLLGITQTYVLDELDDEDDGDDTDEDDTDEDDSDW